MDIPTQPRPTVPTPLDVHRLERLGHGARVDRKRLREVCGGHSAANQWLDKVRKEGLLVPVAWGEYEVADERVVDMMRHASGQAHRRLISWAATLPKTIHADVAFLAPRVWAETGLPWEHPAPVVPFDGSEERAPAQLGAVGYSLRHAETWDCHVGEFGSVRLRVPSPVDAAILLGSNADPRWQRAAVEVADSLGPAELRYARQHLARLRRFPSRSAAAAADGGPAVRTPRWWNQIHDRAVEGLVKDAYAL